MNRAMFNKTLHMVLIILAGVVCYANTLTAPFHYDDIPVIVENQKIRDIGNFWPPSGARYVGDLTFALSFAVSGLNTIAYHAFNIAVHLANSVLVYLLAGMLLRQNSVNRDNCVSRDGSAELSALAAALLFAVHPLQTQAVTYIVQRYASLATMFYLTAVVCYVKFRTDDRNRKSLLYFAASIASTVLAMKTKEIAFTIPVIILLCETILFEGKWSRRTMFLLPFMATMLVIPLGVMRITADPGMLSRIGSAASAPVSDMSIPRADYLITEMKVILTYLRLLFLPVNQVLEYDYRIYDKFMAVQVAVPFFILASLFFLAIILLFVFNKYRVEGVRTARSIRVTGFGIIWFFVTLSVESGLIPIANVIFEHRVYLSSVGFFMAIAPLATPGEGTGRVRKAGLVLLVLLVAALAVGTYSRNKVWATDTALWEDNVNKAPLRVKGLYNLGTAYKSEGRLQEALKVFKLAVLLAPDYPFLHYELGQCYELLGWWSDSAASYSVAKGMNPEYWEAHLGLGNVYWRQGLVEQAAQEYRAVLTIRPFDRNARIGLEKILEGQQGR